MGPPGSGKSTLARRLGAALMLPVHHLDSLYHLPGWKSRPNDAFRDDADAAAASDNWIIDGNYVGAASARIARADVILLLDLPRRVTLPRILRRVATGYGKVRPDSAPGCPERFDPAFIAYCWNWRRNVRPRIMTALTDAMPRVIHLTRPARDTHLIAMLFARRG